MQRPGDHDVLAHAGVDKCMSANEIVESPGLQLEGGGADHLTGAGVAVEGPGIVFAVDNLESIPEGISPGCPIGSNAQPRGISLGPQQEVPFCRNPVSEGRSIRDPGSGPGAGIIRNDPDIVGLL